MTIRISQAESSVEVDLQGGKLTELVLEGNKILGTFPRIDGKIGATHVCVPNFADEGVAKYNLPFHGPARNLVWTEKEKTERACELELRIPQTISYPSALILLQRFELLSGSTDTFVHTVSVLNTGEIDVPVNIAIHNYFNTPHGWNGTQVNGQDITEKIATNQSFEAQPEQVIVFPGTRGLRLTTEHASHLMAWTGVKDGQHDSTYACIEPVHKINPSYFGSKTSMLSPGKIRTLSQKMCLK